MPSPGSTAADRRPVGSGLTHALIVFARVPADGQVKTRLAAAIGTTAATAAYRRLAELVIAAVQRSESYSLSIAYTPADGERAMRAWLGESPALRPQARGDLGARMASAIGEAIEAGATRVVVIGTDCPAVTARVVEEAFTRLDGADLVIGPASDGGYYLIGMSRLHIALFTEVPWSSPRTLPITLERARALQLTVAMLDERRDIDTVDDWRAWLAEEDQETPRPS